MRFYVMQKKTKNKIRKTLKKMREQIYKAICAFFATLLCVACGTTKAVVSNPENGTYTTITITTNNPISTNVDPNTNAEIKLK